MSPISGRFGAVLMTATLLASAAPYAAHAAEGGKTGLHITRRFPGPDGGWDYASFDPARHRVYVAHGAAVVTIDTQTGAVNPAFAAGNHLHAVTPVPGTDIVVTTNSGDNTAKLISATDGHLLASLDTAKDADGAQYDPHSDLVVVICGEAGTLTLVDPKAMKVVKSIVVGDSLEFGAPDGKGRFFVNVEDKNQVAVVDLAAGKVTARYDLPGCHGPTGLAYVKGGRLVADCGNGGVNILDAATGRTIATFKVGGFPDAVIYDSARDLALIPSGLGGTLSAIALSGPANNTIVDTIPTQVGARTGAVDPATGRVYLPTAEYLAPAAPGKRPAPKPGTFVVLELSR